MTHRPSVTELLEAVEATLAADGRSAGDGGPGDARRHELRVAATAVRWARRDVQRRDRRLAVTWEALNEVLGPEPRPDTGADGAVTRRLAALARRIRDGRADAPEVRARLVAALRAVVREQLAVVAPDWLEDDPPPTDSGG